MLFNLLGATEEVVQLRVQMQEALNAQSRAENQCKTLQVTNVIIFMGKNHLQTTKMENSYKGTSIRSSVA